MCAYCYFQVGILKRVLEEVEKVMEEFKGMLYKSMEDPRIELGEVWKFSRSSDLIFLQ